MSDDALVQQLAAVDLFAGLSDKVLRHIASEGRMTSFAPGAHVTEEGSSVSGWAPFNATVRPGAVAVKPKRVAASGPRATQPTQVSVPS